MSNYEMDWFNNLILEFLKLYENELQDSTIELRTKFLGKNIRKIECNIFYKWIKNKK